LNFSLDFDSDILLNLYNEKGELPAVLYKWFKKAGNYQMKISSATLCSGTYFVRLNAPGIVKTKNFVISK